MFEAVPQTYRGVRFRSTLEADWACTLDSYGIDWQYEPEAVRLVRLDEYYRPDFYLPRIRTWLEIKGPHNERIGKPQELRWAVTCPPNCDQFGGHGLDHLGYRDPWRMVVIGGPAERGDRLTAAVPGASTHLTLCSGCKTVQWSTYRYGGKCRHCGVVDQLKYGRPLKLHRAPREQVA